MSQPRYRMPKPRPLVSQSYILCSILSANNLSGLVFRMGAVGMMGAVVVAGIVGGGAVEGTTAGAED